MMRGSLPERGETSQGNQSTRLVQSCGCEGRERFGVVVKGNKGTAIDSLVMRLAMSIRPEGLSGGESTARQELRS